MVVVARSTSMTTANRPARHSGRTPSHTRWTRTSLPAGMRVSLVGFAITLRVRFRGIERDRDDPVLLDHECHPKLVEAAHLHVTVAGLRLVCRQFDQPGLGRAFVVMAVQS